MCKDEQLLRNGERVENRLHCTLAEFRLGARTGAGYLGGGKQLDRAVHI
jgi:hypothetical protein